MPQKESMNPSVSMVQANLLFLIFSIVSQDWWQKHQQNLSHLPPATASNSCMSCKTCSPCTQGGDVR